MRRHEDGMPVIDGRLQASNPPIPQPIPFDHSLDVRDKKLPPSRMEFFFDRRGSAAFAKITKNGVDGFRTARISIELNRTRKIW